MDQKSKPYQSLIKSIIASISLANLNTWATIIAASLAAYTTFQAHKISTQVNLLDNSIKRADLVKDLIETLASSDETTKKDIALITLNRTIGEDEETQLMLAEIAEQIYRDKHSIAKAYAEKFDSNIKNEDKKCNLTEVAEFPASVVAFRVIEENRPDRAQVLLREFGKEVELSDHSSATTKLTSSSCVETLISQYNFFNKVTWLQFNKRSRQHKVEAFGRRLNEIGFNVPIINEKIATELVSTGYTWKDDKRKVSSVRFYHPSDRPRAERLQRLAESFFRQDVYLDDLSVRMPNEPFGQVEIWIYFKG